MATEREAGTMGIFRRHPLCTTCRSPMYQPGHGLAYICPHCDRTRCQARLDENLDVVCGTVLLRGDETTCPKCGTYVKGMA